jgi:hypothetical protein
MQEDKKDLKTSKETEIDLGVFFNLIERIFRKVISFISAFFLSIFQLFIELLLFIKRKIIWLVIGALVGLTFGLQRYFTKGPTYYSEMVVRTNFESAKPLYNQINYFNSLIDQKQYKELASIFGLKENEASNLSSFNISPIDDYLETARLYKNTFLDYKRSGIQKTDTLWVKTIKFNEFKERLKPYDYPLQKIKLYSTDPRLYAKVQNGLLHSVNNNKALQYFKQGFNGIHNDEVHILQRSLTGIDSLRQAYIKKAGISSTSGNDRTNVIISDTGISSPEIELIDKELMIKDELVQTRRRAIEEQEILQVYSGFTPGGIRVTDISRQLYVKYTLWGLLAAFGILLLFEFFKYLDRIDKGRRTSV